ncbi:MAG: phosphoribosylamine--glycine ligase [Acidobacteriota bacterium]
MKILMIGGGGREHALLWKLRESPSVEALYCAPGNAGIAGLAECVPLQPTDLLEAAAFAEKNRIDLTVVGPELPLTLGIADEFARRTLPIFGPLRAAARLEGSKVFAKEFMARHGIPTAAARTFASFEECRDHLRSRAISYPVVLKVDGLAAGKGVVIASSRAEAEAFARGVLAEGTYGSAGSRLLVEECLEGREASFFALCDGERVLPLLACQDYKRIGDGDRGPNTGGMGSLCPSPAMDADLSARVLREIVVPTVRGLAEEGRPYRGLLYTGLMLTAAGPRVLEFNVRFGDPETQALMPRVAGDLAVAMRAAATGSLQDVRLEWHPEVCVSVVLASQGYPGKYEVGRPIEGLSVADSEDGVIVFHAGTRAEGPQVVTAGGRVLAVSALGRDFGQARRRAYAAAAAIRFEGKTLRGDIAADMVEGT